jgi:threonine aldolase
MTMLNLADDCAPLSPQAMAARLAELTAGGDVTADYYGDGGPVTQLEQDIAARLGKEAAIMYPTGTMANLMAVRLMAAGRPGGRFVVQRDSHLYNDAGDNLTIAAGITMAPLISQGAGFTPDQLRQEIARAASARVAAKVVGVAIETPSRRHANLRFDPEAMAGIVDVARQAEIPLLLDGARLFIEAAWAGKTPAEIAVPFDFVYVSLYKYLDAPFGAVLAGPRAALAGQHHERRRHGGGMYQMWPAALLALHALPRQEGNWLAVRARAEAVFAILQAAGSPVLRETLDSNVLRFPVASSAEEIVAQAKAEGVRLWPPGPSGWALKANESWLAHAPAAIAAAIRRLLRLEA